MNLAENVNEGLKAIRSNLLRTTLTALIIAIGIMALVGILTAIDGIQASVDSNLAELGANSFDIKKKGQGSRRRRAGMAEKYYPDLTYKEAIRYKELFDGASQITIYTNVSFNAEVKHGSKTTNPNSNVVGIDENYLLSKGYNLAKGRNFASTELRYGVPVALIGQEIAEKLFATIEPLNQSVQVLGTKYLIIGIIESSGGVMGGNGSDRAVFIPVENANQLGADKELTYNITTITNGAAELEQAMGEATGVMRLVRHDQPGLPDSFEISRSETLASAMEDITGSLRVAGFGIGFITLLGAAIGLMNIMLVSVTERTQEIGVRKALGATPSRIRQQFLIEAIVICLLGGFGGVIFGIAIGNAVSMLTGSSSFIIPWVWIGLGLTVCVVVGIISGYYPAHKASKLDPIEALRFE